MVAKAADADQATPARFMDFPANGNVPSSSMPSVYDEENGDVEREDPLLCGYGACTPPWLQKLHNAKCLLFMLGTCAFIQSFVVNSIFPVGLSTIERQFHMTSTQTGIISSWYDFAIMLAVFPVCHWGNIGHKGRWIGMGTFLMGIGSIICSLPHYVSPIYEPDRHSNSSDFGQCLASEPAPTKCLSINEESSSYLNPYFLLFILGQTLHGVGSTPLFSIGTAYLDENVSQKASPVYLAIHAVVTSVGPVIGLFVGGFLLNIYTDFDRVDVSTLDLKNSADPRWIGAWWLGFLGSAAAALLNAFPILMFARELPEAKRHRQKDVNQMHVASAKTVNDDQNNKTNLKSMPRQIMNLLRNPTFVTTIVLGIFEAIIINGFAAFMPKILETILSVTPSVASYLSSIVIFAAAAGVLIGGVLIRRLCLQVPGMLKMILVCHVIALLLILSFFIQCPGRDFVGINTGYNQEKLRHGETNLIAECNTDCHCKKEWNPVCDKATGQIYYSACFAGCTNRERTDSGDIWSGCSCLNSTHNNPDFLHDFGKDNKLEMHAGFCSKECGWPMWLFLTLLFFSVVASFASGIPSQQIMLRVVPFHQRALAISVSWTFLRLLGFIPGGVLFGLIIDTSCLKWKESACGTKQSCLVHDQRQLSWTIMIVAVVCKLVSILAAIVGYMTYKPTDLDSSSSIQTTDSRGPLSLTVNDDRPTLTTSSVKKLPDSGRTVRPEKTKKKIVLDWQGEKN